MKHEYTADELAELKSIYNESGEAGLQIGEMRALRKAGLLTQGLPAKPEAPSKRDLILAHCKNRIDQGQPFDGKETAEALGSNILSQLRKEGLLPAFDKHSPRKITTSGKKKETMTTTSKTTAADVTSKLTVNDVTTGTINVKPQATADPRAIISNALTGIFDAISALQRTAFQANQSGLRIRHKAAERRIDGLESQLLEGHGEMRIKFNSESGIFTIEPESLAETIKLRTSALDIANLLVNYFDADIIKADINKPSNQQGA